MAHQVNPAGVAAIVGDVRLHPSHHIGTVFQHGGKLAPLAQPVARFYNDMAKRGHIAPDKPVIRRIAMRPAAAVNEDDNRPWFGRRSICARFGRGAVHRTRDEQSLLLIRSESNGFAGFAKEGGVMPCSARNPVDPIEHRWAIGLDRQP